MKRSGFKVMLRLSGLVKPLLGFMCLAVLMGVLGNLAASFITILGAMSVTKLIGFPFALSFGAVVALLLVFALFRGLLRYGEQGCNHYIAFKLLAIIRDKVFAALRRLCPQALRGRAYAERQRPCPG